MERRQKKSSKRRSTSVTPVSRRRQRIIALATDFINEKFVADFDGRASHTNKFSEDMAFEWLIEFGERVAAFG